jgi:tetratricopeptide (TPR) repeat protein
MHAATAFPLLVLCLIPPHREASASSLTQGEAALDAGLWEVAEKHFRSSLNDSNLGESDTLKARLRLAETLIQDSRGMEAIELLENTRTDSQEVAFWKSQAYVSTHQPELALTELRPLMEDVGSPQRDSAILSAVRIFLHQGKSAEAVSLFGTLSPPFSDSIRLLQAELLIDHGSHDQARDILPHPDHLPPDQQVRIEIAKAKLHLTSGEAEQAEATIRKLLGGSNKLSNRTRVQCMLILADAMHLAGKSTEAMATVIDEIETRPDPNHLPAWFDRLLAWMPDPPPPSDPALARLADWIPPAELPTPGLVPIHGNGAASAWPTTPRDDARAIHSMYARAIGLQRLGTPDSLCEAKSLLNRLRVAHPQHPLGIRAIIQQANGAADAGLLETLADSLPDGVLKGEVAFDLGALAYAKGNPEMAAKWFGIARMFLPPAAAAVATRNQLIAAPGQAGDVIQSDSSPELALSSALGKADPKMRLEELENFIKSNPDHPDMEHARLAAAEACLSLPVPDVSLAQAQLDSLATKPDQPDSPRIKWIRLRLADITGDKQTSTALARGFVETEPDTQRGRQAAFILGRTLFDSRNYNEARLVIERLASTDDNPARAQAAWLLAARAASLVPTAQSKQEALILFDKAIATNGPVSPIARLEKARLMIDMNELAMAADSLRTWFSELKANDPLFLPAGLLLAEAIYAQGATQPSSLSEALAVYDKLLASTDKQPALFNRLQYLSGKVLEQLPDPAKPGQTRTRDAFLAYYSVLEQDPPPAEWNYFELCGFSALAMLEKAERWSAAIACARKIASFKGPRAEEAASRANQLQLDHMIWDE